MDNIIIKHFGFIDDNPMTQREIADELGLSQSYVSRIIKRILKNIITCYIENLL